VRDTDPLQLIAHDILQFVLYQIKLHHRVAGEYGAAEGEPGIIGASLPSAGLPLGLDFGSLARTTQLGQLSQFRVLLDVGRLVVRVAIAASPRDRVLGLGRVALTPPIALAIVVGSLFPVGPGGFLRRLVAHLAGILALERGNVQATLREPLSDVIVSTIVLGDLLRLDLADPRRPPRGERDTRHGGLRHPETAVDRVERRLVVDGVFDGASRATLRGSSAGGVETSSRGMSRVMLVTATSRRRERTFHGYRPAVVGLSLRPTPLPPTPVRRTR